MPKEREADLVLAGSFFIKVILVNNEMISKHVIRHPREKHFKQACGLVATIANEPFVAPE